jgi:hypothetical protein
MRGVDYPQQPVGPRRFAAPAPVLPCTGVRDAWLAFATEGWSDGQVWLCALLAPLRHRTPCYLRHPVGI